MEKGGHIYQPDENTTQKISSVSLQKIASLPSLASAMISPATVAKGTSIPSKKEDGSNSENQPSGISQQLTILNNNVPSNTNILIKTTKTNSSGQPTYVAISIPTTNNTSVGSQKQVPLTIHQVKLKENDHPAEKESHKKENLKGI